MPNGTADGAKWVEVTPERLAGWLDSFAQRHGHVAISPGPDVVICRAADGAVAECHVPFPPLSEAAAAESGVAARPGDAGEQAGPGDAGEQAGPGDAGEQAGPGGGIAATAERISAHARSDRTVAVLLVRLGGYAAGVFTGPDAQLAASKVGSRLVHGRSAAGGTSQQRFARRREKQARQALGAAADTAAAVFAPFTGKLDAVVLGGDRRAIAGLRDDPRLKPYFDLAVERFLSVPDPRLAVLRGAPRLFRAIRIRLTEPAQPG